jgi:hypothetical protein
MEHVNGFAHNQPWVGQGEETRGTIARILSIRISIASIVDIAVDAVAITIPVVDAMGVVVLTMDANVHFVMNWMKRFKDASKCCMVSWSIVPVR